MPLPRIDRRCHWLTRNKSSKRPTALVFFDCESNIDKSQQFEQLHTFRLAVASYCVYSQEEGLVEKAWKAFTSPSGLWAWISGIPSEDEEFMCVSHNLDYDLRVSRAFSILPRVGFKPDYAIVADSCTFFSFVAPDRKLSLTDNLSLWPASLKEIGESVGVEKTAVDFDDTDDDELAAYCRNDVRIMIEQWRFWLRFLDEHDLGNFSITIAKQALNAYRHKFMTEKIGIHNSARAIVLERAAYKGGRAEAFFLGELPQGHYYKLDINSLYPAMMKLFKYPTKLVKVIQNVSLQFLGKILDRYLAIANVVVETEKPLYVIEKNGKNVYPTGTFQTTLTTPELQFALMFNHIRGIGRVALYEPADLFSGYVDTFYSMREEYTRAGDTARSKMCKMLMNSLQGKLGQVGHTQEIIGQAPLDEVKVRRWVDLESNRTCVDLTFGGQTIRQMHGGEAYDSFPAIPAHVSAYARLWMWDLIERAGREHVFYIDTDSLIVDYIGFCALESEIDPTALGKLKVESESDHVEIVARKDYRFGDKRTTKGIRKDAIEIEPGKFQQWHFTTLKWGFQVGTLDDVRLHYVERTTKQLGAPDAARTGGWIESPHLTMDANALAPLLEQHPRSRSWIWELDPAWAQRVGGIVPGRWVYWSQGQTKFREAMNLRLLSPQFVPPSSSPVEP